MTIRANGTIYLSDGHTIPIKDRLFTGEADNGPAKNSVLNALLDGADCSVEFTNLSTGIIWERRSRNGSSAILEIDGRRIKKQKGFLEGPNHKIHTDVRGKGDMDVTWEPKNGVEKL